MRRENQTYRRDVDLISHLGLPGDDNAQVFVVFWTCWVCYLCWESSIDDTKCQKNNSTGIWCMIHNYYSLIIWIYLILSNIFDMIPFWFWHPQSGRGAIGISFPFPARLECTNLSYMMRVAITMPGRGQEMLVRTNPKWFQEFEAQVLMRSPTTLINSHKIRVSSRTCTRGQQAPGSRGCVFFPWCWLRQRPTLAAIWTHL